MCDEREREREQIDSQTDRQIERKNTDGREEGCRKGADRSLRLITHVTPSRQLADCVMVEDALLLVHYCFL